MIPYPWEIPKKKFLWESPLFSYGKFPAFLFQKPHGESPPFFSVGNSPPFYQSPYGKSPKKIWKKNFFFGIYGQLFPQKWGCPLGRGGVGGYLPPPMGYMGGAIAYQDYLLRLLVRVLVRVLLVQCAFDFVLSCCQ